MPRGRRDAITWREKGKSEEPKKPINRVFTEEVLEDEKSKTDGSVTAPDSVWKKSCENQVPFTHSPSTLADC